MEPYDDDQVRAVLTREMLGYEVQAEFAKELRMAKNTWNGVEKGKRTITLAMARALKRRFNLPLDWSLDGDPDHLSIKLQRKLRTLATKVA